MKNKFIRFISLLLIVVLILSINLPVASARTMPFTDVPQGAWFYGAVDWAYDSGFVAGTSPTTFSPHDNITRGQFVVFLHRIAGGHRVDDRIRFHDVADSSQYFFNAVNWASDNGVVFGIGGGNFAPNRSITREEMAVTLFRFARFQGRNTSAPITALNRFPDMNRVSDFAQEGMRWAANAGMLRGDSNSGRMNPRNFTTRAEVIVVIRRYVLNEPFTPPPAVGFTHWSMFNGVQIRGPAAVHANDQQIWDFFITRLNNPFAVAGIMGNLNAESGMRSNIVQRSRRDNVIRLGMPAHYTDAQMDEWYTNAVNSGTISREQFSTDHVGFGLSQWTFHSRKREMHVFIMERSRNIACLDDQLEFFWHELDNNPTYRSVLRDLERSTCVFQASNIVLHGFMKPGGHDQHSSPQQEQLRGTRAGFALSYFNRFS